MPSVLDGTADQWGQPYDIPLVIQDRLFDVAGQLYYPAVSLNPADNPFWGPEFFGDHILVNGKAWPFLNVEPKAYRFRLLNGSQARFYDLDLVDQVAGTAGPGFTVVATDGGYLGAPAVVNPAAGGKLVIGTGERIEVVVDFSQFAGKTLLMRNKGKTPYPTARRSTRRRPGRSCRSAWPPQRSPSRAGRRLRLRSTPTSPCTRASRSRSSRSAASPSTSGWASRSRS